MKILDVFSEKHNFTTVDFDLYVCQQLLCKDPQMDGCTHKHWTKKMAILSLMQAGALKLKQYLCFDFEMSS